MEDESWAKKRQGDQLSIKSTAERVLEVRNLLQDHTRVVVKKTWFSKRGQILKQTVHETKQIDKDYLQIEVGILDSSLDGGWEWRLVSWAAKSGSVDKHVVLVSRGVCQNTDHE